MIVHIRHLLAHIGMGSDREVEVAVEGSLERVCRELRDTFRGPFANSPTRR